MESYNDRRRGHPQRSRRLPVNANEISVSSSRRRRRRRRQDEPSASVVYEVPTSPMTLSPPTICEYCGALKFQYETPGFCCSNGQVRLPDHEFPEELHELFVGGDAECLNLRQNSRLFNNFFAFSSLGGDFHKEFYRGIYCFGLHGQLYHFLPNLVPDDQNPKYLQLYFYDGEHEYENRCALFSNLHPSVIGKLMRILSSNPYAQFFQSLRNKTIDEHTTIAICKNPVLDQRVYNAPTSSEVAGIMLDSTMSSESLGPYIVVTGKSNTSHRIMHFWGCYDPLQYPLLFPYGQSGWRRGLRRFMRGDGEPSSAERDPILNAQNIESFLLEEESLAADEVSDDGRHISCREYYCYLLQIRKCRRGRDNPLLAVERLLQQFVVDMYVKLENTRLDFFRNNQGSIRAELYQGIVDIAEAGENDASNVGHRVILPPTFIGGPRDMTRRYLNAMALVQRFGKPDLFVTMTCNSNWPEIKDLLGPRQHSSSRPDLIARVFRARLIHLKKLIVEKRIFGEVAAYVYVVEFQKRGLPHVHFLIILKSEFKLKSPEDYDRFVRAEIPAESEPYLRQLVLNHMMHGPCGILNLNCGCMREVDGHRRCRFNYPKKFSPFTTTDAEGYPTYKRKDSGAIVTVRGAELDNRWVTPYNPYLLALFDCHINVEVCATVNAVKYLYKYVYKGHDRISFNVTSTARQQCHDEIKNFQTGRWVSAPEAIWRIFGFNLFEMSPPVLPLQVHLDNMQNVSFTGNESLSTILSSERRSRTSLTEFFKMNRLRKDEPQLLYSEFPEHYTWNSHTKKWSIRKQGMMIGRMVFVNPSEGKRFYLRLLLSEVRGPTSYVDLLTVNGCVYSSFQEAAVARGLVEQSDTVYRCMDEAIAVQMPHALRRLFVTLLIFTNPANPSLLWEKYYVYLSDDFRYRHPNSEALVLSLATQKIIQILESMGKKLEDYELGHLHDNVSEDIRIIRDIQDVIEAPIPHEYVEARKLLNRQQKEAYKSIVRCVKSGSPGMFFVDGPGGTGKTFLYNAIYAKVRLMGKIVLPTASSGIAASNLPCGRTAHSRFKLPIDCDAGLSCNVPKQGALASLLRETALIFWDEAPMANKASIHSLDLLLQDMTNSNLPFGGKVVVLGGDFRQVLPVLPRKSQQEAVEASLVSSYLWPLFTKFCLVENMRARDDPSFASFLLSLGDGRLQHAEVSLVSMLSHIMVNVDRDSDPINTLLNQIFPEFLKPPFSPDIFTDRAVLAPRNEEVDMINSFFIESFPGEPVVYKSIDVLLDDNSNIYPVEFLHTIAPGGMSPHELVLKKNCPVMLLRNIDPSGGLCNGTRLTCKKFSRNLIFCEIATGFAKGELIMLPRIHLRPPAGSHLPFQFQRTQFPIKLSFAMTINKAQGQTLDNVGIYLTHPCFSHGQLYVALSRARHSSKVKVISQNDESEESSNLVRNVVSFEVLRRCGIAI